MSDPAVLEGFVLGWRAGGPQWRCWLIGHMIREYPKMLPDLCKALKVDMHTLLEVVK